MAVRANIRYLEKYGLTLARLTSLGTRRVRIQADFRYVNPARHLAHLPPALRNASVERTAKAQAKRILRAWPNSDKVLTGRPARPYGIISTVKASDISAISKLRDIGDIWIREIAGRKPRRPRPALEFYAVNARFAIQIEDQTKGMQTFEDRILLVKAFDKDDAVRRLKKEFHVYGEPYLNTRGRLVRWHFEKVLGVHDLIGPVINPKGQEVWSMLRDRRMRRRYEWHPRKKRRQSRSKD